jgi:hypothetical protein
MVEAGKTPCGIDTKALKTPSIGPRDTMENTTGLKNPYHKRAMAGEKPCGRDSKAIETKPWTKRAPCREHHWLKKTLPKGVMAGKKPCGKEMPFTICL